MAHPLRIQRKRTKGYRLPPDAVVVTRPTKWGNPFKLGMLIGIENGEPQTLDDSNMAVEFYRKWMLNSRQKHLVDQARRELRGKKLACFCGLDKSCHADVLCELANS